MTNPSGEETGPLFGQIIAMVVVFFVVLAVAVVAGVLGTHYVDQHNRETAAAAAAALAADPNVDVVLTEWSITAKPSAPAGDVTFNVTNNGTMEHEMIVLQTDTPAADIPVTDSGDPPAPATTGADKVNEDTNVGETGDPNLQPGDTRTFTVSGMAPGHYVLVCNLANHYSSGMSLDFTVTG